MCVAPPPALGADLLIIWPEKISRQKTSRHHRTNHSTSFNVNINHPNDENFLKAREISDALEAKFAPGLVTP